MDHTTAKEIASRVLESPLSSDEERDLALHLVGCPDCKAFYEGLQGMRVALRRLVPAGVPSDVLESTLHRASNVIQGQADPGPVPRQGPAEDVPLEVIPLETVPLDPDTPSVDEPPPDEMTFSMEAEGEATGPMPNLDPFSEPPDDPYDAPPPPAEPSIPPPVTPRPPSGPREGHVRIHGAQGPVQHGRESVPPAPPEGAQIIWEPDEPEASKPRPRAPVGLLVLVGGAVGLGILALTLLTRGGGGTPSSSPLPEASVVQRGVLNAFQDLDSLQASFEIQRLSVYQLPGEDDDERATFSFSLATESGRIVYEEPDRLREERTLEIPDAAPVRTTTVRTADGDLQTLTIEPADRMVEITEGPALGPPAEQATPLLGVLESAISVPAKLLAEAEEVQVVGETTVDGTRAYRVRFEAAPDALTRADRFEIVLDAQTYFPLRVIRTISKADAQVLGPEELLTTDAIDTAFADRDRMEVERIELSSLDLNGVVLPGEFRLEIPQGVEPDETQAGFEVVEPEVLADLSWDVLTSAEVPEGFQRRQTVAKTERLTGWGPRDRYPAPTDIVQTLYFDERTTIVVDQRNLRRGPVPIDTSPIPGTTMPLSERRMPGSDFTYAVSPEVPPHVYGWIEDVFVMVSGYAPADQLLAFAESMQAPEPSPTPTDDEEDEEDASPSPTATGTARATTSPRPTP